jgi:hypothetical protein
MYSTPKLLLVGAAQHLVLGDSLEATGSIVCVADGGHNDVPGEVNSAYVDDANW